jgi:hypothetical protein
MLSGNGLGPNNSSGNITIDSGTSTGAGLTGVVNIGVTNARSINIGKTTSNVLTTVNGTALFKPTSGNDSTTAFQIQNGGGTPLLTADTTNMKITVAELAVTGDLTITGHIVTDGATPTLNAGSAACSTPTVSVAGTDIAGTVTITTGTSCSTTGVLANLVFDTAYNVAPTVTLTAANANAAGLKTYVDDATVSTTDADINTATVPADSTTYIWNYHIIE